MELHSWKPIPIKLHFHYQPYWCTIVLSLFCLDFHIWRKRRILSSQPYISLLHCSSMCFFIEVSYSNTLFKNRQCHKKVFGNCRLYFGTVSSLVNRFIFVKNRMNLHNNHSQGECYWNMNINKRWKAMTYYKTQFVWYRKMFILLSTYSYVNYWI